LIRDDAADLFTGLLGPFWKIAGAPSALAFTADTSSRKHMEAIGYLGEGIVLEATSLGLGTCWVAGSFSRARVSDRIQLPGTSWKTIAVTPLGYPTEKLSAGQQAIKMAAHSKNRKPLQAITSGLPSSDWPPFLREVLEAARWAPSAVNRQPWRFAVDAHGVTLSVDAAALSLPSLKRLDCGIAMLHFEVAARALGLAGRWEPDDGKAVARFSFGGSTSS
jgi:nitroreductase